MAQTVLGTFQEGHGDLNNILFRHTGPERISYIPNVLEKKLVSGSHWPFSVWHAYWEVMAGDILNVGSEMRRTKIVQWHVASGKQCICILSNSIGSSHCSNTWAVTLMLYTDDFLQGCPSTGQAEFCKEQTPVWCDWCLVFLCCQRQVENHKYNGILIFLWFCDSSVEMLKCNVVNPKMLWTDKKNFQMSMGCFASIVWKRWWCAKLPVVKWVVSNINVMCTISCCITHSVRGHEIIRKSL